MKKLLKALLCMMLMATLVFSFAACSDDSAKDSSSKSDEKDDEKDEKKDKKDNKDEEAEDSSSEGDDEDAEKEAREAVEGFMDALCALDGNGMKEYAVDPDAIDEVFPYGDLEQEIKDMAYEGMSDEEVEAMSGIIDPVLDAYFDAVLAGMDYEIVGDGESTDDGYVYEVEFTSLDFETAAGAFEEAFSEDAMNKLAEEAANELAESGAITEESTEEEAMEALFEVVVDKMIAIIEDEIANAGSSETTLEVLAVEDGGEWLVDAEYGDVMEGLDVEGLFE